jgi:hypothetical protein
MNFFSNVCRDFCFSNCVFLPNSFCRVISRWKLMREGVPYNDAFQIVDWGRGLLYNLRYVQQFFLPRAF